MQTLSASDLRDTDISDRIAAKMREFHDLGMPGQKEAVIWGKLRKCLETAKSVVTPEEADAFHLDADESEISVLERELSDGQCVGFCHNDLQYGNIMIDGETKTLTIIVRFQPPQVFCLFIVQCWRASMDFSFNIFFVIASGLRVFQL